MTKETLEQDLTEMTKRLVALVRQICWNTISDEYFYIISEIKNATENFHVQRKLRNAENNKKSPRKLHDIIVELERLYSELYDINLHIYKAELDKTIIDIRYYSRRSLGPDYSKKVEDSIPMLHCKVAHPPFYQEGKKFDVNWESKDF